MTYTEFEKMLFPAIAEAAAATSHGQVEVISLAKELVPDVNDQWPSDAAQTYKNRGWFNHYIVSISPFRIMVTLSATGRRAADAL